MRLHSRSASLIDILAIRGSPGCACDGFGNRLIFAEPMRGKFYTAPDPFKIQRMVNRTAELVGD